MLENYEQVLNRYLRIPLWVRQLVPRGAKGKVITVHRWFQNRAHMREVDMLVAEAQRLVFRHCSDKLYKQYRRSQFGYWRAIPSWLLSLRQKDTSGLRVLDVGCGPGTLAVLAKLSLSCSVSCTDAFEGKAPVQLFNDLGISYAKSDVEREPVPFSGLFDIIIFTEVIEHLRFHPVATLKKLVEKLRSGGRILLSTPDARSWGHVSKYYGSISEMALPNPDIAAIDDHVWQYDIAELLAVVTEAGLWPIEMDYSVNRSGLRHFNWMLGHASETKPKLYADGTSDNMDVSK